VEKKLPTGGVGLPEREREGESGVGGLARAAAWFGPQVGPVGLVSLFFVPFLFSIFRFSVCSLICLKHFYLVLVNFKFCKL
jgi:hypothetical protein